ncbi:hypothetical protein D030_1270B, partial [Vibrio parahaemolyticus AQ3810]
HDFFSVFNGKWQLNLWFLMRRVCGISTHCFCAYGQRGPNRQPIGRCCKGGIDPGSDCSFCLCGTQSLKSGIAFSSASV